MVAVWAAVLAAKTAATGAIESLFIVDVLAPDEDSTRIPSVVSDSG
jgi:hypothetical protein